MFCRSNIKANREQKNDLFFVSQNIHCFKVVRREKMSFTNTIIATPLYSIDFLEGSKLSMDEQTTLLRVHLNHNTGGNFHFAFMNKVKGILNTDYNIHMRQALNGSYVSRADVNDIEHPTHFISNNANVYRINVSIPIRNLYSNIETEIFKCESKYVSGDNDITSPTNIDAYTFLFQSFKSINPVPIDNNEMATVIQKYYRGMMDRRCVNRLKAINTVKAILKRKLVSGSNIPKSRKNDGMIYMVLPKIHRRKKYTEFSPMNIDKDYTKDRFDYYGLDSDIEDTNDYEETDLVE